MAKFGSSREDFQAAAPEYPYLQQSSDTIPLGSPLEHDRASLAALPSGELIGFLVPALPSTRLSSICVCGLAPHALF